MEDCTQILNTSEYNDQYQVPAPVRDFSQSPNYSAMQTNLETDQLGVNTEKIQPSVSMAVASPVTTHEGISVNESSSTPYNPNSVPISPGSPELVAPEFLNELKRLEIAEVEEQDEVQIIEEEVQIVGEVKYGHRDWNKNWRHKRIKVEGEARGKNKDIRRYKKEK